jgi:general secretion pathway protein M
MRAPPALASLRQQARAFWSGLALRERLALGAGLAALGLFLVWWIAVAPALRTLREAPAQLDQLEREVQLTRAVGEEVKSLRAVAPVSTTQAAAALKAATDRLGSQARLVLAGDRATLALTGVGAEALRNWLGEVRGAARARPVEVSLSRSPQGYNGTLVVTFGSSQ